MTARLRAACAVVVLCIGISAPAAVRAASAKHPLSTDSLTCPLGARQGSVAAAANATLECAMSVVPGLDSFLPTLGGAVETHPVAVGPADLSCHRGSFDEAKLLWCDRQFTRRTTVRDVIGAGRIDRQTTLPQLTRKLPHAVQSLLRVCRAADNADVKWARLAACAGVGTARDDNGRKAWTAAAVQ
eukprot:CAMPEP_0174833288 /NCGR_PEP_ID=MMETSP1114-20130205/4149_1 /TAXON_ID=312471 /ORGANISM="Neobodo designis, Strain CCAP 1951/1" /LENGTH=185 /DNA_ID=CAMNT_0016067163 /DNA_START=22 /DNA_END=576 /DNA_ORIENTATION=+